MSTSPQVVLITGASSGFGQLIAQTLARKNFHVFATMRNVKGKNAAAAREFQELARRESLTLQVVELDVTEVAAKAGHIDVLVNNAGFGITDLVETVPMPQAQRQFDVNVYGILRMNRAVLPHMTRQKSGLLLHVSSGAGRVVIPGMGLYCASKFAMEALAETYRYELAPQGIDSVVIQPGAYATSIIEKLEEGEDPGRKEGYGETAKIPGMILEKLRGARANPQEVADAVLRIIETPAGTRALRYRIGPGAGGVEAINEVCAQVQIQLLESFGISAETKFVTKSK
jgi:NAD(P)-dependent dehydrogenase (short-subunit alcohol dehydrogenase family)